MDAKRTVDGDNAGRDARQHSLDEGAAQVELGVRGAQRVRLLLKPPGHTVEGRRQRLDLVFRLCDRHPNGKVTCLHPPGGIYQFADGSHEPIRERKAVMIENPTMIKAPRSNAALNRSWLLRERARSV